MTSALDGVSGQRHAPAVLYPRAKDPPGTHCTGGWVGLRAGLDTEDRGKILCPCRGSNPDRPVVQPVVRHYTDWVNPAYAYRGQILTYTVKSLLEVLCETGSSPSPQVLNCFSVFISNLLPSYGENIRYSFDVCQSGTVCIKQEGGSLSLEL
jgi:hypothetical protein